MFPVAEEAKLERQSGDEKESVKLVLPPPDLRCLRISTSNAKRKEASWSEFQQKSGSRTTNHLQPTWSSITLHNVTAPTPSHPFLSRLLDAQSSLFEHEVFATLKEAAQELLASSRNEVDVSTKFVEVAVDGSRLRLSFDVCLGLVFWSVVGADVRCRQSRSTRQWMGTGREVEILSWNYSPNPPSVHDKNGVSKRFQTETIRRYFLRFGCSRLLTPIHRTQQSPLAPLTDRLARSEFLARFGRTMDPIVSFWSRLGIEVGVRVPPDASYKAGTSVLQVTAFEG